MKKRTKIILITSITIIACYCAFDMGVGIYQNKQATAIRYWCSDEQNVPTYNYIDYNGEKFYELDIYYDKILKDYEAPSFLPVYPYFFEKISFNDYIYVKNEGNKSGATPFYKLNNDAVNTDVLFEKNNSFGGPSDGWYFFKKDFVFPNIRNTKVKELLLQYPDADDYTAIIDKDTIDKVVNEIKAKADISQLISKKEYGDWIGISIRYEDSPLIEKIGWINNDKFEYLDDIDEWMKDKIS